MVPLSLSGPMAVVGTHLRISRIGALYVILDVRHHFGPVDLESDLFEDNLGGKVASLIMNFLEKWCNLSILDTCYPVLSHFVD